MTTSQNESNYIYSYVEALLETPELIGLTPDQLEQIKPQITKLVEDRVGIVLLSLLPEDKRIGFSHLQNNPNTSAGDWRLFWQNSIPNFEQVIQKTLEDFAVEATQILGQITGR